MAEFPAVTIVFDYSLGELGPLRAVADTSPIAYGISTLGGGDTSSARFKMRALADPGPGYTTWISPDSPDFLGALAPTAVQVGTAVVADSWGLTEVQQQDVATIDVLQSVSDSALATDPGNGVTLVLVDTTAGTWDDLDVVSLPISPQAGAEIFVKDDAGQANTFRIVIDGNGTNIDGSASIILDTVWAFVRIVFNGTDWSIIG